MELMKDDMDKEMENQKMIQGKFVERFLIKLQTGVWDNEAYEGIKNCQMVMNIMKAFAIPKKSPLDFLKKRKEESFY